MDNPLSLNRYTYGHNNPLRFVDPTGHVAAEGAGSFFGGSHEDLVLHWADKAVAYADANRMDFGDAVDAIVPADLRAEVHEVVYLNGAVKANRQAGDMPGLGLGAAGAGAVAGASSIKIAGKTAANQADSIFGPNAMEHIFHGNISKKGGSGYHHQSMMSQATLSNISTPNQYGVYKATVTINGKSKFSTFFPDSWNRTEVINAIKEVYSGVKINGKGWYQGKTSQGMEIKMWINENNQIETAFPLY